METANVTAEKGALWNEDSELRDAPQGATTLKGRLILSYIVEWKNEKFLVIPAIPGTDYS